MDEELRDAMRRRKAQLLKERTYLHRCDKSHIETTRNIGLNITRLRKNLGLTLKQLSFGVLNYACYNWMRDIENGKINISVKKLAMFATFFEVEVAELVSKPPRPDFDSTTQENDGSE